MYIEIIFENFLKIFIKRKLFAEFIVYDIRSIAWNLQLINLDNYQIFFDYFNILISLSNWITKNRKLMIY